MLTSIYIKSEEWSSQLIFQFEQLERRSLKKKSGHQRDSNPWLPRYRCDALPTELWSHTLGASSIYWVHVSREEWNNVKCIWNSSYLNCGCRWKWRMIIAVNFPIWAIGKKKLRWSFFTFIYIRNSNMNYFIYTSRYFTPHGSAVALYTI